MSLVFQNIDPPPPSPPGGTHSPGGLGGGGSIFWKTINIGLPSYSNNISTLEKVGLEVNKCAIHSVGAIRCEQRKLIRNSDSLGLTNASSLTQSCE